VEHLNAKIRQLITGWNDRKHPFVWAKTSGEILKKANRRVGADLSVPRCEPEP
jgi:hypothetical protein